LVSLAAVADSAGSRPYSRYEVPVTQSTPARHDARNFGLAIAKATVEALPAVYPMASPVRGMAAAITTYRTSLVPMQTRAFEKTRPSDYLMRLAASDMGRAYKSLAVSEMSIGAGDVVLDLGCGPGADLLAFADATGPSGRVIGVDTDPDALRQARDRTAALPHVAVHQADVQALSILASSADRVHTDRVLQHVPDPRAALAEARRVLRIGGTAVFAEPDWDTLIIDYPDQTTARAYTRFITDRVIRNATIGRQLPRLAADAGFHVQRVIPVTGVFRDSREADQVLGLLRVTGRAVESGYLTQASADSWLTFLAAPPFFASSTLFITIATAA
jgi:ubiquinone/menaquinone biosynthesis C-methylase UbiE